MGNKSRTNGRPRPFGNDRKSGNAGSKTPRETSPQRTDAQKETMQAGLRILARMIARTHLRREAEGGSEPASGPPASRESLE